MAALSMTQQCLGMEDGFPKEGSTEEKLKFLIQYAILSPSVRNSQPWKFKVVKETIQLFLDRSHANRTTDPDVRELTISCGAALKHLQIAARKFGYTVNVDRMPKGDADLLAVLTITGQRPADEVETILFYSIHKWLNVPKPFRSEKRVPHELLNELNRVGNASPTWLHLARSESSRDTVAGIIAQGDQLLKKEAAALAVKKASGAVAKRRTQDNSNMLKMDVADGAGHVANYIKSFFKRASGDETEILRKKATLVSTEPILAILGSETNTPEAWLLTGERLAEILLRGMSVGVRASLLSQAVDQPGIREKLVKELELSGFPQVVFRLGFPDAHAPSGPSGSVSEQLL